MHPRLWPLPGLALTPPFTLPPFGLLCIFHTNFVYRTPPFTPSDRVGADPAGSRVLEAFLGGSAPPKVKAGLLRALAGR